MEYLISTWESEAFSLKRENWKEHLKIDPFLARNIFMTCYILYYTLGIYIVIKDMCKTV